MKNFLFTTTALVLSAGVAAADVSVSGDGRAGVVYDGSDWNFSSRIRAQFNLSGETDNGVAFGGTFRADQSSDAATGTEGEVYVSGPWGRIALGDTDGAAENAIGDLHGVGYTGVGDHHELFYLTHESRNFDTSNPVALYSYTTGGLTFFLSLSDGHFSYNNITRDAEEYAAGLSYSFGDFGVAIGYESSDLTNFLFEPGYYITRADQALIAGTATFGATEFKAVYAQGQLWNGQDFDQYGASVVYSFDATTLTAFARELKIEDAKETYIGAGVAYDLGGGMAVKAGVVNTDTYFSGKDTIGDFGVTFNF